MTKEMGIDDFDALSVTDSGVFSDNDCSSGRSSPISISNKEVVTGDRERFAILTYDQVKRIDGVLNEMVTLEGRGNFPALELKLKDLLTAVKERLLKEGLKIRDIRLNGGAASYALMMPTLNDQDYCYVCGYQMSEEGGPLCSCLSSSDNSSNATTINSNNNINTNTNGVYYHPSQQQPQQQQTKQNNSSYNDIDLIFGMELTTSKHFDRILSAVLDALLDLLPPQVSRKRMSPCALKEAYVSKMVKVCEGDRWSLIALGGNGQINSNIGNGKGRGCSVELKFVDSMRRQYEFSVDSFQIVLDSLMLFYKCSTVNMSGKFYPTVVGESVYGDFNEALFHLHHGLIATRHPEEIRGGGLLKYCSLIVRGYRPAADVHSIQPLQRYMCSRFFIDFPEVDQQELKLRTYLANHMSGASLRLRYTFLITLYHVVDSSTVCLMGHERRQTLSLIQRLACQLFANDYGTAQGIHYAGSSGTYHCYTTYYMPQATINMPPNAISCALESSQQGTYYNPSSHPHHHNNGSNRYHQQHHHQNHHNNNSNNNLSKNSKIISSCSSSSSLRSINSSSSSSSTSTSTSVSTPAASIIVTPPPPQAATASV